MCAAACGVIVVFRGVVIVSPSACRVRHALLCRAVVASEKGGIGVLSLRRKCAAGRGRMVRAWCDCVLVILAHVVVMLIVVCMIAEGDRRETA